MIIGGTLPINPEVVDIYVPPTGVTYLTTDDGRYLLTDDGRYIVVG